MRRTLQPQSAHDLLAGSRCSLRRTSSGVSMTLRRLRTEGEGLVRAVPGLDNMVLVGGAGVGCWRLLVVARVVVCCCARGLVAGWFAKKQLKSHAQRHAAWNLRESSVSRQIIFHRLITRQEELWILSTRRYADIFRVLIKRYN